MEAFFQSIAFFIRDLGAAVWLPVPIFFFAVIMGAKAGRAFRAAVTIGVAFVGINLVIGEMWGTLSETAQAIVTWTGADLTAVDVGWPSSAAIAFGTAVGAFIIPIGIGVNILFLVLGLTRTLNIDLWNFWHFAFLGSMIMVATNNIALSLFAAAVFAALMLFMADWTAKSVQKFFNLPGISIPHGFSTSMVIPTIILNWVIDRIPGLKDWEADIDAIQRRFGVFGEPVVLGLVIGLVLGIVGFVLPGEMATRETVIKVLQVGVSLAAVMFLLPRMVAILMEGLIPVSEAAREFMSKRFGGADVHIGLDSAILIGHPSAIAASLVMVPIVIVLAIILPGNRFLPFADLAVFPFLFAMMAPLTRGNVGRMLIIGTLAAIMGLYMGTWMAPYITDAAPQAGFAIPEGAAQISAVGDGWDIWVWMMLLPATIGPFVGWIVAAVVLALVVVGALYYKRNTKRMDVLAGAPVEVEAAPATPAMD
ncbi:MAG: PTS sugar transporter subunit IIC [Anaerolineales bacterium]|nr:PTS sugar transporter subunit IIC [Anaerolineales bacterium]